MPTEEIENDIAENIRRHEEEVRQEKEWTQQKMSSIPATNPWMRDCDVRSGAGHSACPSGEVVIYERKSASDCPEALFEEIAKALPDDFECRGTGTGLSVCTAPGSNYYVSMEWPGDPRWTGSACKVVWASGKKEKRLENSMPAPAAEKPEKLRTWLLVCKREEADCDLFSAVKWYQLAALQSSDKTPAIRAAKAKIERLAGPKFIIKVDQSPPGQSLGTDSYVFFACDFHGIDAATQPDTAAIAFRGTCLR